LLYLISPSARKSHHAGHHDTEHKVKHDLPVPMRDEHSTVDKDAHATPLATTEEPDLMKDDEGTVANVASSVALSEVRYLFICSGCTYPLISHFYGRQVTCHKMHNL